MLTISVNKPRMGRPPLYVKPMVVRLPEGVPERIDAVVGEHKRAEFIREAVELLLAKRETKAQRKAIETELKRRERKAK
jgi:Arc/MetJ-type ribon-helix-helix transcriptional regulator